MLDPKEWLSLAQACPLGTRQMHAHSCGSGKKLLVENKPAGYAAWCYRCNEPGWVPKRISLAEKIAGLRQQEVADRKIGSTVAPPMPAVFDPKLWPDVARVWAYKAGLDDDWLSHLGFYYNAEAKRVVMPVIDKDRLIFWQARGFDPERPKYISAALSDLSTKPLYKAVPFRRPVDDTETLVLTEDILSAVKVGEAASAWSLLGTALTPLAEAEIAKFGASRVLVWLDPDEAGVKARRKIVPQLRAMGIDARAVRADLDPKLYPLDEIRRKIA